MPPRASCHSVRAGYTLCLCVIPIDSAGAQGQTCKPWTQPPQTGLESTEIPQAPVQVLSLVFVSFLPSVSLCLFIYRCAPLLQNDPWFRRFFVALMPTGQFSDHFPQLLFISNTTSPRASWWVWPCRPYSLLGVTVSWIYNTWKMLWVSVASWLKVGVSWKYASWKLNHSVSFSFIFCCCCSQ